MNNESNTIYVHDVVILNSEGDIVETTCPDQEDYFLSMPKRSRLNPLTSLWRIIRSLLCLWSGDYMDHLQIHLQKWMYSTENLHLRQLIEEMMDLLMTIDNLPPCSTRLEVTSRISNAVDASSISLSLAPSLIESAMNELRVYCKELVEEVRQVRSSLAFVTSKASTISTSSTTVATPMNNVDALGSPGPSGVSTSRQTLMEGQSGPLPQAVRISGCQKPPCNLIHGTNITLEIDFEALEDSNEIVTQVNAFSMGAEVNYPLPDSDVCDSLTNGECPLDAGEVVTYILKMPISSSFPSVPVVINFSLLSGSQIVSCFSVSCQVV